VLSLQTENAELKKQCKTLQKDISRLKSQGSSCESEMELRTEVSALRMDKECLEKKVRKFAMHCQRLEDDKAGMKDALRSCNVKVDDYDGDLSEAVIQLCDRLTSVEETHAKKAASLEQRDDSLQKENKKLHHEIQQLTAQLHTSGLEINELSNSLKRRVGNSQEVGELKDKLGRLEEEYLQLMQDHKALKKVYHETKMKLDVAFTNVNAETTVDFSVLGASTAVQPSSSNNRSTRSSSAKEQSQTMEFSSDTMELTEMARRYAGHQAPSSSRMMVNAKQHSTKKNKRPALTESTNRSNHSKPEGTQEDSTGTKRQRREVTRLSRDEGAKRRTPGLGESSSAGGSASSENPAECNQS
jgi:predicted nuclease with TOPRIM domain